MRITVIGGTGFVGEYLIKDLSQSSQVEIKVLYRSTPPSEKIPKIEYLQMDGSENIEALKEVLDKTDCLVILARPNKVLVQNIIESNSKLRRIIYASTVLIYPDSPAKQDEDSDVLAANKYEQEKIDEEKMLIEFAKISGIKLTIARLTNVYGDIKNRALIHWILMSAAKDQVFKLNNQGKPVRDFIFVEDAAKYLELLVFLPQEKQIEIFNVCTGEGFSINQVIEKVEKISGKKLKTSMGDQTKEKESVIGDNKKIVMATGFKPKYNLESGLKKAYQNYLKTTYVS